MKKIILTCVALGVLFTGNFASAEQSGIYIAPKFFYSYQRMDDVNRKFRDNDGPLSNGLSSKDDSTFGGALALGYDFQPNFGVPIRTEFEYAIRSRSEGDDSFSYRIEPGGGNPPFIYYGKGSMKFDIQTLFLNFFYDFDTGTPFTPYIGYGVGAAFIKAKGSMKVSYSNNEPGFDGSASNSQSNFAFNLAAGIGYDFNENLTFDLGYRYLDLGKVDTGTIRYDSPSPDAPEFYKYDATLSTHEVLLAVRYTF
jgi:opacity protein-like surface antigen